MRRQRASGTAAVAALALTALALAGLGGCAGIPWSGAVQVGVPVAEEPDPSYDFIPSGPLPDASPREIVQGFVDAGTGARNDYAVARQFLTEQFAATWNPAAGVTVTASRPEVSSAGVSSPGVSSPDVPSPDVPSPGGQRAGESVSVSLTVAQRATVDAAGRYAAGGGSPQFDFTLVQTADDQWRIDSAPDGILLSATTFEQVFGAYSLYFYDPAFRYLVPDLRWFPTATSATRIVTELIAGPSAWLGGGVLVTAFPEGTELTLGTVPVESGRARVDLNQLPVDAAGRERLHTQLVESLTQVTTVSSVTLSVDQSPVEIAGTARAAIIDPVVDEQALIVRDGTAVWLDAAPDGPDPVRVDDLDLGGIRPSSMTFDPAANTAVAVDRSGAWLLRSGFQPLVVDRRPGQAAPTLDGYGWAWTASDRGGQVRAADGTSVAAFDFRSSAGHRITQLAMSRDSTRMLFVVERAGRRSLVVGGISRDGRRPVGLGATVPVGAPPGDVVDAAWFSDTQVAVLLDSGGDRSVWLVQIGGVATPAGDVDGAVSIAAANPPDGLRALTADGVVVQWSGNSWSEVARDVETLATVR